MASPLAVLPVVTTAQGERAINSKAVTVRRHLVVTAETNESLERRIGVKLVTVAVLLGVVSAAGSNDAKVSEKHNGVFTRLPRRCLSRGLRSTRANRKTDKSSGLVAKKRRRSSAAGG
ncbi:MAG TPA: hypothetical protein VGL59_05475 [Polyangia bacterium]